MAGLVAGTATVAGNCTYAVTQSLTPTPIKRAARALCFKGNNNRPANRREFDPDWRRGEPANLGSQWHRAGRERIVCHQRHDGERLGDGTVPPHRHAHGPHNNASGQFRRVIVNGTGPVALTKTGLASLP